MQSPTQSRSLRILSKAKIISYWIVTGLITFELIYGALWDFNLLNQGYVFNVLTHLGYPLYLAPILAVAKIAAAIAINLPRFYLLKEWAYAGVIILFGGAFLSHLIAGDGADQFIWSLIFGLIALASYVLRPAGRRLSVS